MTLRELIALLKADLIRLNMSEAGSSVDEGYWIKIFNPRFTPVLLIRLSRYFYLSRVLFFISPILTWLNVIVFGIECTPKCEIGSGLMLPHTVGTVIGAYKIGANATIFQGVTLGALAVDLYFEIKLRPVLGDGVIVGSGAKVLGGIQVCNNVKIGANAVVLVSLPEGVVAVGVPARIVNKTNSGTYD